MKINFQRSGGFAGIQLSLALDTDDLPAGEGLALQKLVEEAAPTSLVASEEPYSVPDIFEYDLTIENSAEQYSVHFDEFSMTNPLRSLVARLTLLARTHRAS